MTKTKQAGIYKITCKVNGKSYVGQSTNLKERLKDHFRRLQNNNHYNAHLQRAWNKHGGECFVFEVIEKCNYDFSILNELETYWIEKLETLDNKKGFNISSGGGNAYSLAGMSESERNEIYKKIGKTRKAKYGGKNHPNYGKSMSEEQREKIRQFYLSDSNPFRGKKRPDHSKLMTGAGNPRAKTVICVTTDEIFSCAKDAGERFGTTNSNILKCCRHVQSYAGITDDGTKLVWEYLKKEEIAEDDK